MKHTFIKFQRSDLARELVSAKNKNPFILLSAIALRAAYKDDPKTGLKAGQCYVGHKNLGMSEAAYRHAKATLVTTGVATFDTTGTTTGAGTIATLINTDVYDINIESATEAATEAATGVVREQQRQNKNDKNIKKVKKFIRPTTEQVHDYMIEKGVDKLSLAEKFIDTNLAKGWLVGKTKTPMKDWKAAVRTWLRNEKEFNNDKRRSAPSAEDFLSGRAFREPSGEIPREIHEGQVGHRAKSYTESLGIDIGEVLGITLENGDGTSDAT